MPQVRHYRWQVQALPTGHTMNQTWGSHLSRYAPTDIGKSGGENAHLQGNDSRIKAGRAPWLFKSTV